MFHYILRRLMLLPLTLFCIILVNFVIINLAPGDPTTVTEVSSEGGASRKDDRNTAMGGDDRYLQFREYYGLTLPIILNTWPWIKEAQVKETLWTLVHRKESSKSQEEMGFKDYDRLRIKFGDQARFIMPILKSILNDPAEPIDIRRMASRFFVRGATKQAILGPDLSPEQKQYNERVSKDNDLLARVAFNQEDFQQVVQEKIAKMNQWYEISQEIYLLDPDTKQKVRMFFFDTRFFRYMQRVLTLDFGTLRNDQNKTVISEVTKRFKYSFTLAIVPMAITFFICQFFGFLMAVKQNRWPDFSLSLLFLMLYAIPVFVVAPFLIEKVALHGYFPFTNTPIPYSGFTSPDAIYNEKVSYQRLFDVLQHIFLPIVAIMYGSMAAESRLSRTAVLEVLRSDYVRTAWAKGVPPGTVLVKHVGRNAAITIVTSLAGSLGIILGGSLIVETLFDINGFGKFFYDAIINRDYNVIMFSALAGSFLTLVGYLVADIAYTLLDPRITLD